MLAETHLGCLLITLAQPDTIDGHEAVSVIKKQPRETTWKLHSDSGQ